MIVIDVEIYNHPKKRYEQNPISAVEAMAYGGIPTNWIEWGTDCPRFQLFIYRFLFFHLISCFNPTTEAWSHMLTANGYPIANTLWPMATLTLGTSTSLAPTTSS
jgi:hypothetical protein